MRTAMVTFLAVCALAGAAQAKAPDKVKLGEARSLIAEVAACEQQRQRGRVTATYADNLAQHLRKDLKSLETEPGLSDLVPDALRALHRHDAAALAALRDRLVTLERSLGRAP